ncbi:11465_t:CDS:1 [Funneliformis geosporum]|nr:11465_t:CDS:1 [Funneliformis geosporum]
MVAKSDDIQMQEKVLKSIIPIIPALLNFDCNEDNNKNSQTTLSLFVINTIFKLYQIDFKTFNNILISEECIKLGQNFANMIEINLKNIYQQQNILESPNSLYEYQNALLPSMFCFFKGLIQILLEQKQTRFNKKNK